MLSPYVLIAKRLTELVKKHTGAIVVWGGVGPTITPDEHIKLTDIICIGEGERAFEELIIAVRDQKNYSNIKNLWINDQGKITKNPQGPLIQELDTLPFAEYGSENMYFIEHNKLSREDPELDHSILWPTIPDPSIYQKLILIQIARSTPLAVKYLMVFTDIQSSLRYIATNTMALTRGVSCPGGAILGGYGFRASTIYSCRQPNT